MFLGDSAPRSVDSIFKVLPSAKWTKQGKSQKNACPRRKTPACIKERLSTRAHTSQSPTEKRKRDTTETNEDPAGCQPCDPVSA